LKRKTQHGARAARATDGDFFGVLESRLIIRRDCRSDGSSFIAPYKAGFFLDGEEQFKGAVLQIGRVKSARAIAAPMPLSAPSVVPVA
jgi:hypothetical protein